MKKLYIIGLSGLLLIQCTQVDPLERALQSSGNNRPQLDQVLRHYSRHPADSLKYKAACFLIENMPGHGWYEGEELDRYKRWIDSTYQDRNSIFKFVLYEAFFQQPDATDDLTRYEDIHCLDSNFLITYIDSVFSAIRKRPWLNTMPFAQLCEHILPYRTGHERPCLLFDIQDSLFQSHIADLLNYDNIRGNARNIFIQSKLPNDKKEFSAPICYRGRMIDYDLSGCVAKANENQWRAKLLLCPLATDMKPAFPNRNDRHCWSVIIDNKEINRIVIITPEGNKLGKTYRNTFSHQPHPVPDTTEFVPPFFRSPFYKDVTSSYSPVKDVTIDPVIPVNTSYGYLCVFNDLT